MKGREGVCLAHDCSPAVSRRCGEGAERPGLARCCCRVTVSTKQTAPRSRFPRALRWGPCSDLAGSSPGPLLDRTRDELHTRWRIDSLLKPAASRRTPSIDARKDPRPILPPGFIARPQPAAIEERGSDALPTDGMGELWGGAFLRRGNDAAGWGKRRGVKGLGSETCLAGGGLPALSPPRSRRSWGGDGKSCPSMPARSAV